MTGGSFATAEAAATTDRRRKAATDDDARRPDRRPRGPAPAARGGSRARAGRSVRALRGVSDPRAPSPGTAYYTYGVVPLDIPADGLVGTEGVGARPVELVASDDLAALTS